MTISIDYLTKTIFIPRADLVEIQNTPSFVYQLNMEWFYRQVTDLQDDQAGSPFEDAVANAAPVNVGGVLLARVITVINNFIVEFEDGQYAVNLTGANTNLQDIAVVNQVSVRPNNSAGLQDLSTLLQSAYGGVVTIDKVRGQPGTVIPLGTRGLPVNNFADALTIATQNSLPGILVVGDATLSSSDFSRGFTFYGDSQVTSNLVIESGANIHDCSFENMTITGTLDGDNTFRHCKIININYVNGFIIECALEGTITLGGGAQCSILDSWSNVAGGGPDLYPAINMGSSGNSLAVRNFSGGLALENWDGVGDVSIDMSSGRLVVRPDVVGGTVFLRGISDLEDMSTGTTTVVDGTVNAALDNLVDLTETEKVQEIWKILGLDPDNIQTISDTTITVGNITVNITRDEQAGTTTVDRQ